MDELDLRVLVVCTANVCRSRAAQALVYDKLTAAGLSCRVGSAGVRPVRDAPVCQTMKDLLDERDVELPDDGGARPVTRERLERADLVLVSELRHRAALARIDPRTRYRTFTIIEASTLARALGADVRPDPTTSSRTMLLERIGQLNQARGTVALPGEGLVTGGRGRFGRLSGRVAPADPLDVVDVHGRSRRHHRRALSVIDAALDQVVSGLTS